jgi:hypothetical protein
VAKIPPPSLGDEPATEYKTIVESHEMPGGGRKGLLAFLDRQLNIGGVQKFVVELGKPVLVKRKLKADQVGPEEVIVDGDLFEMVMEAQMVEFAPPKGVTSPFTYLFHAFNVISEKKLKPRALFIPQLAQLNKMVGRTYGELFGVEIIEHKELPDGVMVLAATTIDDPLVPVYSLRMEMNG